MNAIDKPPSPIDLTLLSIETLEAIKVDSINMVSNFETPYAVRIEARENIQAVDEELDRRINWAKAVQYELMKGD